MRDSTIWQQGCKRAVDEKMKEPVWAYILPKVAAGLNDGAYPKEYLDVLCQKWARFSTFDSYDAWCIIHLENAIINGDIAIFQIRIGCTPLPDKYKDEQNELLSRLPYPFLGKFYGGRDEDGWLRLEKPINAFKNYPETNQRALVLISPDYDFSLEVGYNGAEKMWKYLLPFNYGVCTEIPGVARWPYGQDRITVLANTFFAPGDDAFDKLVKNVHDPNFENLLVPWDDGTWNFPIDKNLFQACGVDNDVLDALQPKHTR